mgnify:CR=1 FL=1
MQSTFSFFKCFNIELEMFNKYNECKLNKQGMFILKFNVVVIFNLRGGFCYICSLSNFFNISFILFLLSNVFEKLKEEIVLVGEFVCSL